MSNEVQPINVIHHIFNAFTLSIATSRLTRFAIFLGWGGEGYLKNCNSAERFKVIVHLERCFQFFVCNCVNMHRLPTNLYINGKLMKLSR